MSALPTTDHDSIVAGLSLHGFLRRPRKNRSGHREWLHFSIRTHDLVVIINLSVVDDPRTPTGESVRMVVLGRHRGRWLGELHDAESTVQLPGGQLRARSKDFAIELNSTGVKLSGFTLERAVSFDLALTPRTQPSIARDVSVSGGAPINWLVVPRLSASGLVTVGGVAIEVRDAPAYHDHNWGYFTHRDFTWQWGHAHGVDHTFVLSRLLDRAQSTVSLQTLMVWEGARISRIFRGADLTVRPSGFLRPRRPFTLPALASLLADGATEVPRELRVHANADGDVLDGIFVAEDLARIVVPEPESLRTTIIHEVVGTLQLRGRVHDRAIELVAPAVFEFLRSAR